MGVPFITFTGLAHSQWQGITQVDISGSRNLGVHLRILTPILRAVLRCMASRSIYGEWCLELEDSLQIVLHTVSANKCWLLAVLSPPLVWWPPSPARSGSCLSSILLMFWTSPDRRPFIVSLCSVPTSCHGALHMLFPLHGLLFHPMSSSQPVPFLQFSL